jgi:hypothetical protein
MRYNFTFCFVWVEAWPLTLREEHKLRVFENRVLRKIFGPKREKVAGVHNLYASSNIVRVIKSRRMRLVRLVAHVV